MKVLQIHSYYRRSIPSGENTTVDEISSMLREKGIHVFTYVEESDKYLSSRVALAKEFIFHQVFMKSKSKLRRAVRDADLVIIHNTFPILSLADLAYIEKSKKPIIRVIHNYRKTCLKGTNFRNDTHCTLCSDKFSWSSIKFSCYNNKKMVSLFLEFYKSKMNAFEKRLNQKGLLSYVTLSDQMKNYMIEMNFEPNCIEIIPNIVAKRNTVAHTGIDTLYCGRWSPEKGISRLVEMWTDLEIESNLHVVSDIAQADIPRKVLENSKIIFHGPLFGPELEGIASICTFAIFPTLWSEPFGKTIIEALYRRQIILSTRNGIVNDLLGKSPLIHFLNSDLSNLPALIKMPSDNDLQTYIRLLENQQEAFFNKDVISERWIEALDNSLSVHTLKTKNC
jgi:glycosyltransferase involved in cell wall biosynthesis